MSLSVVYIAKHSQANTNDDEGAIVHAFTELGHTVNSIREVVGQKAYKLPGDFALFHHWTDFAAVAKLSMPKVFWYFDLVDYPDSALRPRCDQRIAWMRKMLPLVNLGFCTDGDFAKTSEKLVNLRQGADSRYTGAGTLGRCGLCHNPWKGTPLLFTGISRGGGQGRMSFVEEMKSTYGDDFLHVEKNIHGRKLADLIAGSSIVVAPDHPATNLYWSNRVYLSLGFGAFMLHPYCEGLAKHYEHGKEIVFYRSRQEMHDQIKYYLGEPDERKHIAANGLARTMAEHTYRHRVAELVSVVKEQVL